ncbi:hypothetical protein [Nocardioides halotolerans]|jgi:hypothetical protein|uniref:hypothetical protein n=1 Tax=Nocardioides halotolerans TaxID=433660 RepID=UPI00040ECB34|nr:hypothetical protein [Nocardioides halotolerans]
MSTIAATAHRSAITTKQRVGLVLCGLYSLASVPSVLESPPDGEEGPPMAILVVGSILGLIGLVATVMAWRGNRVALRVAAGAIIIVTLTGLPAFFVDVPMFIKAFVGVSVVLTVVAVVLMFSTDRRPASITD